MIERVERLLSRLEQARHLRPSRGRAERAIDVVSRAKLPDANSLIRFHEALLFLRAYPQTRAVLVRADRALASVPERVRRLERDGADLSTLDTPEVSGISGTAITTDYSYDVVSWLAARFPSMVDIDWEELAAPDRLRALWPQFLPLLEEEALEDANVPYLEWLDAGKPPREGSLTWLLDRLRRLSLTEQERAERYDALGLSVQWRLSNFAASRTGMRWAGPSVFFHDDPLLSRRDVSLERELAGPPLSLSRVSLRRGLEAVAMTRTATALRYREYYGFTYADPATVRRADVGRGVQIYLFGLPRERRLPLRAGFAAFFVKNGIPAGYVEALAFFERVEVGFNIYYTFREGESAWIFAKVVKLLNQELGAASFSIDPYQIGHENKEAIESGAFWFYRKLGFRPTDPRVARLVEREEERLVADPKYRTPPATLRRIATCNLLYEIPSLVGPGSWDRFHIRNLGLAVNRRMGREFGGDPTRLRRSSQVRVARLLDSSLSLRDGARLAFESLALVLDLIPDLGRWSPQKKRDLIAIIRAKGGADESVYLRRMQRHAQLRAALMRLGSKS